MYFQLWLAEKPGFSKNDEPECQSRALALRYGGRDSQIQKYPERRRQKVTALCRTVNLPQKPDFLKKPGF
jgi:hypothetical protein